ncbi:M23 family metallopeptidase [Alicyclobacillus dauci]|uniref:M23 family metallopeptidase n=1 Tax=Alicyclobacillus dauci TaxID=1475485 RepID=A0ABY6Z7U5_9BACL|nr:M23 family metallopeptidase [Alicyclobacillus dauci]WAH38970.1 M23 family metallopeptidase [Alicyclobacillus dauci]
MADVKRRWPWQARHISWSDDTEHTGMVQDESREGDSVPAPSRWVTEPQADLSPYGFSEDDGGLRQVESGAWRKAFSAPTKPSQGFVPRTSSGPIRNHPVPKKSSRASSTLMWQTFCAAVLVGIGYFVQHADEPIAKSVDTQTQSVFDTDYTDKVQPMVAKAFSDLHLSVPTFGGSAVKLHSPLQGTIVDDYGKNHPEVWIAAAAGSSVQAAGSGTVLTVVKSGNTELVKIDNGSYGTSIYAGLGSVTVKENEYVTSGEVIGKLPTTPSHPALRFSLVKNGQYENPHDFIQFSGGGQ